MKLTTTEEIEVWQIPTDVDRLDDKPNWVNEEIEKERLQLGVYKIHNEDKTYLCDIQVNNAHGTTRLNLGDYILKMNSGIILGVNRYLFESLYGKYLVE